MLRLKKSKKATMFLIPVLFGFLLALTLFLAKTYQSEVQKTSSFVGEKQLILMNTYQKTQHHLLYIDLASKYSSKSAVIDLAENGGFENESLCESFLGYNLYNNKTDICFPERLDSNFAFFFNNKLDNYLSSYKKAFLTKNNYHTSFIQKQNELDILGMAKDYLNIQIVAWDLTMSCPIPDDLVMIKDIACETTHSNCELNQELFEKLKQAQSFAKEKGYDLLVTSATRTLQHQQELFDMYGSGRAALPSCTAPHISGKAVDVVLTKNGKPVEGMSSKEGEMYDLSIGKRADLQEIMCKAGFQRFSGEFWHYEYKTERWKDPQGERCVLV